ncbi:hypothetical protein FQA39_LY09968 [Lamprigera yunnana]|nr:hypothetical protein FQA39_LY09968 [Lamprigera yunnana]
MVFRFVPFVATWHLCIHFSKDINENEPLFNFFIWPARLELYILCLSGFLLSFLMQSTINLTILAMVKEKPLQTYIINGAEMSRYKSDKDVIPGVVWPAIFGMISRWVPLQKKTRFSTCSQGIAVGGALSYSISGWIIAKAGNCVVMSRYLLASDESKRHPRISLKELNYIKENREKSLHTQNTIPWISIFLSIPVWAIAIR